MMRVALRIASALENRERWVRDLLPPIGTWWAGRSAYRRVLEVGLDHDFVEVDDCALEDAPDPMLVVMRAFKALGSWRSAKAQAEWARSIASEMGLP
jgi:hypothetical protein